MQRPRQQYQKNSRSDRQLEEDQCLTDFRYQPNRRRQDGSNSTRQRHENGGHNRNDRYYPRYHPPPNGFAPKSEPNLRRTTSRPSFRPPFCPTPQNGGSLVCSSQQMQQTCTVQTIMNTTPSHLQFTQLQQTQTISGIPANLMGFPCYTVLVPPPPIVNSVPSVMQPPPPHYSNFNLPPNIHADLQSQKIFVPLIATTPPTQRVIQQTPLPTRYNTKPSPKKRDHALAIIDPVTHRDIFDSKREQNANDLTPTNSSTASSHDDLKCASKYVEARPDQIQAAVDAQEHSGEIKDLQSLNFIDLMQHHNISALLADDDVGIDDAQDDAEDDAKDDAKHDTEDDAKGDVQDDIKGTVATSNQQEPSLAGSLIACLLDISSDTLEESDAAHADNHDDSNDEPAPGSSLCAKQHLSSMSSMLSDISSSSSILSCPAELDLVFSEIFPNAARGSYKLKPEVMNLEVPFRVSDGKRHRYTKNDLMVLRYAPPCLDAPRINRDASCFLKKETPTTQRSTPMQSHYCHQNVARYRYHGGRISRRQSCTTLQNSEGNEKVQLNEVSNAWRPKKLRKRTDLPPEQQAAEEVFQKVRSLLNKLTKEKLDLLVDQLLALTIDTGDKINGIMLLIFEKAIDELHFSQSYALLCLRLIENQLHVRKESKPDPPSFIMFKQTLLDKAQEEFNTNVVDQTSKREKLKPILDQLEQCRDQEKKAELKALHYDQEKRLRRRSVGTVKFIGELYRVGILTNSIIGKCIRSLLDPDCEDKLECLSKLLTTVGEKYETAMAQRGSKGNFSLDDVFEQIKRIILCKKTSSRVRFMLQDLTDARQKWLDKLGPSSPTKTSTPNFDQKKTQKRPQDQHPPFHQKRKNGGGSVAQKGTNSQSVPVLIQQTLKHNTNRKTSPVLGLVRSIHHCKEIVTVRRKQVEEHITCEILDIVSGESSVSLAHESKETNVIKIVSTALEDGLNEALALIKNIPPESLTDIIYTILSSYLHLVQTKTPHRLEAAQIVLESIKRDHMTKENFLQGYNRFAEEISDIIIDVPGVWSYIFEFLGPIIESGQLNVRHLWNDSLKNAGMGKKFLKHFLQHYVVTHRHGIVRKLWNDSELKFTDFMPEEEVVGFVEENQFEFVSGNDKMADDKKIKKFTIDMILETVKEKMNLEKQPGSIVEFLNETVPTRRVDRKFVNMLTNTIVTSSMKRVKNFHVLDHVKFMFVGIPILKNFIKISSFDMEVLCAIEWLVRNSQCPRGQLVKIFYALHGTDLIQKDTFLKWRSTRDAFMTKILSARGMATFYQKLQEGDFSAANPRLN